MSAKAKIPPNPPLEKGGARRRPHRRHSAISRLPQEVQLRIREWLMPGPQQLTYDEISEKLHEMGHEISRKQVRTHRVTIRDDLERIKDAEIRTKAIMTLIPPGTTIETGRQQLMEALLMESLLDAPPMQAQSIEDFSRVVLAHQRLGRAAQTREQWEHKKGKQIKEAVKKLKDDIRKDVAGDVELVTRLYDLVAAAEERMLEKIA